ncbi:septum formation family protein [Frankia sp. AgB1.9]|uniref:septum formation family protein n=1 Tax=unclassified Frankia TaxID=2632575 RepID=UPI00193302DC|nr:MULTISPECIES: septum formation family protein [unclassified Frankia]MBL7494076.1 septum formation family protein [Frankia sp. AgW1.1]MBL7553967.1 septum formation family protein [Frankia sp. AgB1.9]MBL7617826.1 septum formation family protein [Frankia sp. AgB1.8]
MTDWKPWRRSFWWGRNAVGLDVVLVLAAVTVGVLAFGPTGRHDATTAADDGAAGATTAPEPTTTGDVTLDHLDFRRGDCYRWTQGTGLDGTAQQVPCAEPHLFEAVSTATLDPGVYPAGGAYPTETGWASITDRLCAPAASEFLGYPLDPDGLFATGAVRPSTNSWDEGDRSLVCGLRQRSLVAAPPAGELPAFTGIVEGADQSLVYPAGSCLAETADGVQGTVPCEAPHQAVAVGAITLPARPGEVAPDTSQFQLLAEPRCMAIAKTYLGQDFHDSPTAQTGWVWISAASWKAGSRSFTCTVDYRTATGALRTVTSAPTGPVIPTNPAAPPVALSGGLAT